MVNLHKAVAEWTTADVREWLTTKGFSDDCANLFGLHKIDGKALLLVKKEDLRLPPMQIPVLGDLLKLNDAISKLQCSEIASAEQMGMAKDWLSSRTSNLTIASPPVKRKPRTKKQQAEEDEAAARAAAVVFAPGRFLKCPTKETAHYRIGVQYPNQHGLGLRQSFDFKFEENLSVRKALQQMLDDPAMVDQISAKDKVTGEDVSLYVGVRQRCSEMGIERGLALRCPKFTNGTDAVWAIVDFFYYS